MNSFTRAVFLDFLTNPQHYKLRGNKTKKDFIDHLCDHIESSEEYSVFYDETTESIFITQFEDYTKPILKISFQEEFSFHIETTGEVIDFDDKDELKSIGMAAMYLMNAHTEWETNAGLMGDDVQFVKLQLALSESKVKLTEEEKEVIFGILKRISKDFGYIYDKIENKSFEIELRGIYYDGTPMIEDEPEEDGDSPDFEWL